MARKDENACNNEELFPDKMETRWDLYGIMDKKWELSELMKV